MRQATFPLFNIVAVLYPATKYLYIFLDFQNGFYLWVVDSSNQVWLICRYKSIAIITEQILNFSQLKIAAKVINSDSLPKFYIFAMLA